MAPLRRLLRTAKYASGGSPSSRGFVSQPGPQPDSPQLHYGGFVEGPPLGLVEFEDLDLQNSTAAAVHHLSQFQVPHGVSGTGGS